MACVHDTVPSWHCLCNVSKNFLKDSFAPKVVYVVLLLFLLAWLFFSTDLPILFICFLSRLCLSLFPTHLSSHEVVSSLLFHLSLTCRLLSRCCVCEKSLRESYYQEGDNPYCKEHFYQKAAHLCFSCSDYITGPTMVRFLISVHIIHTYIYMCIMMIVSCKKDIHSGVSNLKGAVYYQWSNTKFGTV